MLGHDEIPLPPTAVLAAALLQRLAPETATAVPQRRAGAALLAAGSGALLMGTLAAFRGEGTTVDPTAPQQSSTLVTAGANRFTRNPMYLGMAGLLAAHAAWRGSWQAWLPVAAFVATMDRFQIPREERALQERFGRSYTDYCSAVPRWLGPGKTKAAGHGAIPQPLSQAS
ncbi:protein-S-isoprenylcysteine O-methyltransferase Ste14 [Arthrobacter stackebrandtii]|uniref:Protein-S-isoprenylcysteine O-methyltransferase Ste14 n=1 Tax=Arthrobacter stackebrandtii TaxID=272161 RepID=A0ABS4YXK4_9MICC|nr:isoprenylcysteine carboxylmethyltransferase family protein [Arthrobacter stackebrandtii]MBP2413513.1 protein-S-isoprenylcysteine O-methyltransferase Ste14 [Arthrobacter stackebrandtii]PYH00648.1 isoprenylcysteine carboxylmethyltransferase family protein [Arthrobacter stackebrandtii]